MHNNELNHKLEILKESPIRKHVKENEGSITIFENEKNLLNDIDKIIDTARSNICNPLKLVVLGELKAGKSTLINSLIGKKVSYTNVVEATATIQEVAYSNEERIIIEYKSNDNKQLNSLEELDELMDLNRNNQDFFQEIIKIRVNTNIERLKEITIVDTPGLNTITTENAQRTDNYIANSDVILWVINAHHLGQSDIVDKIEEVLDYGKPIIGVINRIDEIDGDIDELIEYVQDEMGYMFEEIFATSAKKAWDGYIVKDKDKVKESNINELYNFIVNNIEKKANKVQDLSVYKTIETQLSRDLMIHNNTKIKIETLIEKINGDIKELDAFNKNTKKIINNKIDEWISRQFFEKERDILIEQSSKIDFNEQKEKYINDRYLDNLVSAKYKELNNYLEEEWKSYVHNLLTKEVKNLKFSISIDKDIQLEINTTDAVAEGATQGGLTAAAAGLGLAGYAAWLGPAAAYVTIGGAIATFVPPLAIAGITGGAVFNLLKSSKNKQNNLRDIDNFTRDIKEIIRTTAAIEIKMNLQNISDLYYDSAMENLQAILTQCNTSLEEINNIKYDIENYVNRMNININ